MPHSVRLFCLTEGLQQKACEIGCLIEQQTPIIDSSCPYSMHAIIPRVKILTFKYLTALVEINSYGKNLPLPYSDVVVILGHSTITQVESLCIQDIFTAFVQPKPPSLLIFLGCCGGNLRYGPLKKLSLLPEWQGTVFSFYQRRVYIDELCNSLPVLAVHHYVHLPRENSVSKIKRNINKAFRYAEKDSRCTNKYDMAFLLNSGEEQTADQILLDMVKKPAPGISLSFNEIPPSCWHLAMYHKFVVEKNGQGCIKNFNDKIKAELTNDYIKVKAQLVAMIDEKCKVELKRQKLCDIIKLVGDIQSLKVTDKTLALLKANKWKEVDHLQFFVALLHGYWGKNPYFNLREHATHLIMEMMKSVHLDPSYLRKYQLCCVGYCLFSPEIFITFDKDNQCSRNIGFFCGKNQCYFI